MFGPPKVDKKQYQLMDIVNMWVKEKLKFFVNYDKSSQQSRDFHYEVLKTLIVSSLSPMDPTRVTHLDPSRRSHSFPCTRTVLATRHTIAAKNIFLE